MCDEFLRKLASERGEPFRPFDIGEDYLRYVDGKPRTSGVRDFLSSRGIELPEGTPDDSPHEETVHGPCDAPLYIPAGEGTHPCAICGGHRLAEVDGTLTGHYCGGLDPCDAPDTGQPVDDDDGVPF